MPHLCSPSETILTCFPLFDSTISKNETDKFDRKNKTCFFDENWLILENVNDIISGVSLYLRDNG